METFKSWIIGKLEESRDTGICDLAQDVACDDEFPDTTNKSEILDYLHSVGACQSALDVFEDAYSDYAALM